MKSFQHSFLLVLFCLSSVFAQSQTRVGLDNWFNRETDKSGKPFHYLWTDSAFSGFSQWGQLFTERKAQLFTLNRPSSSTLASVEVYIIVDPDTTSENPTPHYIQNEDIKSISQWVKKGGVLVVLANDRPNCEFTHLNKLMKQFGMFFNPATQHRVPNDDFNLGAFTSFSDHYIFKDVSKIYMKETSTITILNKSVKPLLVQNNLIYMAEVQYGKGTVLVVVDPWIYNEYIDHARLPQDFDNLKAAANFTDYILSRTKRK